MAPSWIDDASAAVSALEAENASHETRKTFVSGDGLKRVRAMIATLAGLRARLEKLNRA
jgi:hypothetical protein